MAAACSLRVGLVFQKQAQRLTGIEPDSGGNIQVFRHIQAPVASLVFGDVGGRFPEPLRNRGLRQPRRLALGHQQGAKPAMTFGVYALWQGQAVGSGCPSKIASSFLPK